jgi:Cu/Ag efflux protein CusF
MGLCAEAPRRRRFCVAFPRMNESLRRLVLPRRAVLAALLASAASRGRAAAQCVGPEEVHEGHGRVVGFVANGGLVRIAHDAVPGVMGAMTMAFAPCPSVDTTALVVGDEVRFRFTRGPGGGHLLLWLVRLSSAR